MNNQSVLVKLFSNQSLAGTQMKKVFYGHTEDASHEARILINPYQRTDRSTWFLSKLKYFSDIGSEFCPENFVIHRQGGRIICEQDVIELSRFLLNRQEEILQRNVRDLHGRFPGRESLLYRAGLLNRPVVDEYGALLRSWLREIGEDAPDPPRKIDKIYLTHDVDAPYAWQRPVSYIKATVKNAIRLPSHLFDPILAYCGVPGRDPFDCFDWILEQDNRLKRELGDDRVQSIFFFMAGGQAVQDGNYDIRSRRIRKLIDRLHKSGATIGLHASYEAGMRPEIVATEAEALRRVTGLPITKNRYHFLSCREPEHLRYLAEAGITDDFSMGYADQAGFRVGTCRPYKWFDPETEQETALTIHPLTVMECTLNSQDYMNLGYDQARLVCIGLLEQVKKYNGEAVLLWHNTEVTKAAAWNGSYQRRLYLDVLAWLKENAG